jgi:putative oxidoreductase
MFDRLSPYAPQALAVLRIVAALLFIEHGTAKMLNFPSTGGPGMAFNLFSLFGVAAVLEIVGGLLVLVGFFTRPVAFILAGEMAVAYWMVHYSMGGFFPLANGGEAAILFCFVFLYLVFAGPGAWSVNKK